MVRRIIGRALLIVAAAAAALAVWALFAGGLRLSVGGFALSVRDPGRAGLFALFAAALGLFLDRGALTRLPGFLTPGRLLPALVVLAATTVGVTGLVFGTKAAGGADVYGYVSQAALWRSGNLHVPMPLAARAPWPSAERSFAPLAYRAKDRSTAVPIYAPGIPLLMALLVGAFGEGAEYWLTPLAAPRSSGSPTPLAVV